MSMITRPRFRPIDEELKNLHAPLVVELSEDDGEIEFALRGFGAKPRESVTINSENAKPFLTRSNSSISTLSTSCSTQSSYQQEQHSQVFQDPYTLHDSQFQLQQQQQHQQQQEDFAAYQQHLYSMQIQTNLRHGGRYCYSTSLPRSSSPPRHHTYSNQAAYVLGPSSLPSNFSNYFPPYSYTPQARGMSTMDMEYSPQAYSPGTLQHATPNGNHQFRQYTHGDHHHDLQHQPYLSPTR